VIIRVHPDDSLLLERAVRTFTRAEGGHTFARTPGALAFVATDREEISGWCWGYHLTRPDSSSMVYLHQLEVAVEYRRSGIGRQLLRAFMAAGAGAGATRMFLTTGAGNVAARALYDSMGGGLATQGPTVNYWFVLGP
jgi:ribosomal protein S18 acetylase RimI-like enzyme